MLAHAPFGTVSCPRMPLTHSDSVLNRLGAAASMACLRKQPKRSTSQDLRRFSRDPEMIEKNVKLLGRLHNTDMREQNDGCGLKHGTGL